MKKPIRVLLADDSDLDRLEIKKLVEQSGNVVIAEASDGEEVLSVAKKVLPDVILLDIKMPRLNGIETAKKIADSVPVPIVFLTAYESKRLIEDACKAGIGAYLMKPSNKEQLSRAIAVAIARFNDLQELKKLNKEMQAKNAELQAALEEIKTLRGIIPICSSCHKVRTDKGYWQKVESYLAKHTLAEFSHGLCPECLHKMYPDFYKKDKDD